jgi:hypothetical protein
LFSVEAKHPKLPVQLSTDLGDFPVDATHYMRVNQPWGYSVDFYKLNKNKEWMCFIEKESLWKISIRGSYSMLFVYIDR